MPAFVAEFNGEIAFIKLKENNIHKITSVKGHTGWCYGDHLLTGFGTSSFIIIITNNDQ